MKQTRTSVETTYPGIKISHHDALENQPIPESFSVIKIICVNHRMLVKVIGYPLVLICSISFAQCTDVVQTGSSVFAATVSQSLFIQQFSIFQF